MPQDDSKSTFPALCSRHKQCQRNFRAGGNRCTNRTATTFFGVFLCHVFRGTEKQNWLSIEDFFNRKTFALMLETMSSCGTQNLTSIVKCEVFPEVRHCQSWNSLTCSSDKTDSKYSSQTVVTKEHRLVYLIEVNDLLNDVILTPTPGVQRNESEFAEKVPH